MQTELSVRITPQLEAFRQSMQAATRAVSVQTSGGITSGAQMALRDLRTSLNSSLRLSDVASQEVRTINAQLRQVNTAIITQRFNESLNRIKESIGGVLATFGTANATLGKPLKASIDFEDSFASVKKVLDDATDDVKLKEGVLKMSVDLGSSTKDLNAILESAGQMGIKGHEDLLKFTSTVQKMSVAFDISADEAGKSMANIRSILGLSMDEMVELGDTINHVSNNTTAKAGDIIDMLKRLGGTGKDFFAVGKNFGLTAKQVTGLGSAMLDLGMTPDVASTALSAMLNKLQAGGKPFKKWFDEMGMDFEEWSELRAKDPSKALRGFFDNINQLDSTQKTNALKDMFGLEHLGKLKTLTGSLEKYDKAMELATSNKSKGSMEEEFQAKATTTAHELKRLGAQMEVMWITIGDALLPVVNKILVGFRKLLEPISAFAQQHKGLTKIVMFAIGALLLFKTAIISLGILGPLMSVIFTPLLRAWTLMRFSILGNVAALLWHKAVSVGGAMINAASRGAVLLLGGAYRLLSGQIALSTIATRVFGLTSMLAANLFGGAMKLMRLALIASGIGVLIALIGLAIYAIVENWDSIKGWFVDFWNGLKIHIVAFWEKLKAVFFAVLDWFKPIIGFLKTAFNAWIEALVWQFNALKAAFMAVLNWLQPVIDFIKGLFGAWVGDIVAQFDGLKTSFSGVFAWFEACAQGLGGILIAIKDYVAQAWQGLLESVQPIIDFLMRAYNWYKDIFSGVLGKVAGALGFSVDVKSAQQESQKLGPPPSANMLSTPPKTAQKSAFLDFDYSKIGEQKSLEVANKADNSVKNSHNTQTINIYTQSDPQSIVGAIKQSSIGQYSYADED